MPSGITQESNGCSADPLSGDPSKSQDPHRRELRSLERQAPGEEKVLRLGGIGTEKLADL